MLPNNDTGHPGACSDEMASAAMDSARRRVAYSTADARMHDSWRRLIDDSTYVKRKNWNEASVEKYLDHWDAFLNGVPDDPIPADWLPPSWSPSEVFPCVNQAMVGDAAVGKSTSMFQCTQPGMTITAPLNKAANSYIEELASITQPYSLEHTNTSNTWYKMLGQDQRDQGTTGVVCARDNRPACVR